MFYLIIFTVVGTLVAFVLYLLLIRKYYWGPRGAPKQEAREEAPKVDRPASVQRARGVDARRET